MLMEKLLGMKRWSLFLSLLFVGLLLATAQTRNKRYEEYIHKYKGIAIEQMKRHKIPASITLAQGLLESGAGQSELTRKSNNHFGIKCGGDWRGKTTKYDDDARNECFRVYANARESYEDHSRFLVNRPRYAALFKLKSDDYKGWAYGLKKAGYATNPNYATSLIRIIELYDLHKYDTKAGQKWPDTFVPHQTYVANKLLYVIARQGDTFESLSDEFGISKRKLRKYNDLYKGYALQAGDIIYLEKKRSKALKPNIIHKVQAGESMYSVSQKYGIRLKSLYKLNKAYADKTPQVGDYLRLR